MNAKVNLKKIKTRLKVMGRIMTKQKGLSVNIGGNRAFRTVTSVQLPAGAKDDIDYLLALEGFNDHEFGHHSHSKECLVLKAREISPLCGQIQNAFEDIRMEQLVMSEWPGAVQSLNHTIKWCMDNDWFPEPEKLNPSSLVQMSLLYRGRAEYCNQTMLSDYAQRCWSQLEGLLAEGIYQGLEAIHIKLGRVVTEQDGFDLALEVIKLFEDVISPPDSDDSSDQDSESGQGGDDDSSDQDSESGQGDDDSSDQGDDDSGQGQQGPSDLEKEIMKSILEATPDDLVQDLHEIMKEALEEAAEQAQVSGLQCEYLPVIKQKQAYRNVDVNAAKKAALPVKRVLKKGLFDKIHKPATYDRQGDSYDESMLAGVPSGNLAIFKTETLVNKEHAAVALLIDNSGSMNCLMQTANESALALAFALDALPDVSSSVSYYPCDADGQYGVNTVLSFQDKLQANIKNFGVDAWGSTPTGEAINSIVLDLNRQRASKKLLFVITDGQPNCGSTTANAIAEANALGIKVVGFGLGTERLDGFEDCGFVVIDDVATLHKAVGQALKEKLF